MNKNKKHYTIIAGKIEEIEYKDWVLENGMDETTTPYGVAPRIHIRCQNCRGSDSAYGCGCEIEKYVLYSWGVNGNNLKIHDDNFGNGYPIEEAEKELFEVFTNYAQEDDQATSLFDTMTEAKEALS